MRILVVTNLYPPHALGGYEERCRVAVDGLRRRGHEVSVLTSVHGVGKPQPDPGPDGVWRSLVPIGFFGFPWCRMPRLAAIESSNHDRLRRFAAQVRPEVVWCWNLGGLGKDLLVTASALAPLVTDISDHWVFRGIPGDPWRSWCARHPVLARAARAWWRNLPDPGPRPPLGRAYCTSAALRELTIAKGFPELTGTPVIYCGIEVERFAAQVHVRDGGPLRCLYAGRLHPDKGVHTACRAVARAPGTTLDVVGGGEPDYESALRAEHAGDPRIRFLGRNAPERMPELLRGYQVLVFPSEWEEPFALTPLEASSAGLAVVGTTTGGSGEFLVDGETALTYPAGDPAACAAALGRLAADPELSRRLAARAQAVVAERFTTATMIDRMEAHLRAAAGATA